MFEICSDLFKTCLKIYFFCQHSKKAKKWPNGQTILFLANSFKKGQMATLMLRAWIAHQLNICQKVLFAFRADLLVLHYIQTLFQKEFDVVKKLLRIQLNQKKTV